MQHMQVTSHPLGLLPLLKGLGLDIFQQEPNEKAKRKGLKGKRNFPVK